MNKIQIWINKSNLNTPWEVLEYLPIEPGSLTEATRRYKCREFSIMAPVASGNYPKENFWCIETWGEVVVMGDAILIK